MNNTLLLGLAVMAMFGSGLMIGWWLGRSRQRPLQRELEQLKTTLQHSRNEMQQREEALHRIQQELQQSREELHLQQEELQRSQQDFLHGQEEARLYRIQVTQHFTQTADLLQVLTLNYRTVYEHLATGAEALCGGQVKTLTAETLRERLLALPREDAVAEGADIPQPPAASGAEPPPSSSSQESSHSEPMELV